LKKISIAFQLYATDHNDEYPFMVSTNKDGTKDFGVDVWPHYATMSNELTSPRILVCPKDRRPPAKDWASLRNQNVSYFPNLDATRRRHRRFWPATRI
jgi:hypothetical protein